MPTFKLTDAGCRGLKVKDRPYRVFDGRGRYLYDSESGSKIWRATCAFSGKRSTVSFGPSPDVSPAEAWEKLSGLKRSLCDGIDPGEPKPGMFLRDATKSHWGKRLDLSERYR